MAKKSKNKRNREPVTAAFGSPSGYLSATILVALLVVVLIPLIFAPKFLYDMYDLTKATALRFSMIIILVAWTIWIFQSKKVVWRRTPLDLPILFFLIALTVTTLLSNNIVMSFVGGYKRHEGLLTWFAYLLIFFTATNWIKHRWQVIALALPLFISTTIMSVYGILQHFGIDFLQFGAQYDVFRSFATSGNPVFLGGYLAFALPLLLAAFLLTRDNILKGILMLTIALGFVCLVFTLTRGGWFGFAVAFLILIPLIPRSIYKRNWVWLITAGAIAIVAVFVLFIVVKPSAEQAHKPSEILPRLMEMAQLGGSAGTRAEMWKTSSRLIRESPLKGVGLENYKDFFPQHRTLRLIQLEGEMAMPDRPHNEFFYLPSVIGVPGYLTYLWIVVAFAALMLRYFFRLKDDSVRLMMSGALAAGIAYWIQTFFSFSMVVISPVFWLVAGTAVSLGASTLRQENRLVPFTLSELKVPKPLAATLVTLVAIGSFLLSIFAVRAVDADAHYFRGITYQNYSVDMAVNEWEESVSNNPTLNLYRLMLASGYQRLSANGNRQMLDKSLKVYDEALRFDPRDEDILAGLADLNQFVAYQFKDQKAIDTALAAYERAIQLDPNFSHALMGAGRIYLTRQQLDVAEQLFNRILIVHDPKQNPTANIGILVEALNALSVVYAQRGQFERATQYTQEALNYDKNNQPAKEQLRKINAIWKKR